MGAEEQQETWEEAALGPNAGSAPKYMCYGSGSHALCEPQFSQLQNEGEAQKCSRKQWLSALGVSKHPGNAKITDSKPIQVGLIPQVCEEA